jgi:hypothetical protein
VRSAPLAGTAVAVGLKAHGSAARPGRHSQTVPDVPLTVAGAVAGAEPPPDEQLAVPSATSSPAPASRPAVPIPLAMVVTGLPPLVAV